MEEVEEVGDPLAAGVTVGLPIGENGELTVGVGVALGVDVGLIVGVGVALGVGVTLAVGVGVGLADGVDVGLADACANWSPVTYTGVVKGAKMTSSKESVIACFKEIVAPPVPRQSMISKGT